MPVVLKSHYQGRNNESTAAAEIIELSCGRGHVVDELCKLGYAASGTNYSRYEDALPHIPIINGVDVTNMDTLPARKFDCVIFSESIQNIADHQAVYRAISHLLPEGGLAIITTLNAMNISRAFIFCLPAFQGEMELHRL